MVLVSQSGAAFKHIYRDLSSATTSVDSTRMEDSSGSETSDLLLHRVLSASLDAEKSWFALNSVKCGGKPSRFCSSGFAQVFPDEYRQIALDDLVGCDGFPAPASWFSASSRRAENVYVASAFGLVVGILRQKTLDAPFFQTEDFQLIRAWINGFNFVSLELHPQVSRQLLLPLRARQNQIECHFLSTTKS